MEKRISLFILLFVFLLIIPYLHFKVPEKAQHDGSSFPLLRKLEKRLQSSSLLLSLPSIQQQSTSTAAAAASTAEATTSAAATSTAAAAAGLPLLPPRCSESFTPQCDLYWYVQYWRHNFRRWDCFPSPLSITHKLTTNPTSTAAAGVALTLTSDVSSGRSTAAIPPLAELKYLVFEPDRGGWNNIRMAAETAILFAIITGRVLVLPPSYVMYLLWMNGEKQDDSSSFGSFFDMRKLQDHVRIISMEEFLATVAIKVWRDVTYL